jgi:uncharacterized repeat protein (TIGR03803 family)
VLHAFTGGADGGTPYAPLIRDATGDLYGTTVYGGSYDCGVVFKLDPSGNETVLHTFAGPPTDGNAPTGGVVRDAAGNLYGTTQQGGSGYGLVFKLDSAGNEMILHIFTGRLDGGAPDSGLTRDAAGNLYGIATSGGAYGHGVVFKLDPTGNETVLHAFTGEPDGSASTFEATAPLVLDGAGNLFGTTLMGGTTLGPWCPVGCGVVFKLDPAGNETVLYRFQGKEGAFPNGVIRDAAGNLYGTTEYVGPHGGGSIFKLSPAGALTILYGDNPSSFAGLLAYEGYLYGTTFFGGNYSGDQCSYDGCGLVFKLKP